MKQRSVVTLRRFARVTAAPTDVMQSQTSIRATAAATRVAQALHGVFPYRGARPRRPSVHEECAAGRERRHGEGSPVQGEQVTQDLWPGLDPFFTQVPCAWCLFEHLPFGDGHCALCIGACCEWECV